MKDAKDTLWDDAPSTKAYMRDIQQFPLITKQEEIVLAARIAKGDEAAFEKLVNSNLRLVVKIASDFVGFRILPFADLIAEGNKGLIIAARRFDPSKGGKLSTYAAFWIKQCIRRGMADSGRTIRIPVHAVDKLIVINRAAKQFSQDVGREPTDYELSESTGYSTEKISLLRQAAMQPTSLDKPMGEDDDGSLLGEFVQDEMMTTASQGIEHSDEMTLVMECMDELPQHQQDILCRRFGMRGHEAQTLEEVGVHFGVTRERIRQIQNVAYDNIRKIKARKERSTAVGAPVLPPVVATLKRPPLRLRLHTPRAPRERGEPKPISQRKRDYMNAWYARNREACAVKRRAKRAQLRDPFIVFQLMEMGHQRDKISPEMIDEHRNKMRKVA